MRLILWIGELPSNQQSGHLLGGRVAGLEGQECFILSPPLVQVLRHYILSVPGLPGWGDPEKSGYGFGVWFY